MWIVLVVFVIVQLRNGCVDQRFAECRRHVFGLTDEHHKVVLRCKQALDVGVDIVGFLDLCFLPDAIAEFLRGIVGVLDVNANFGCPEAGDLQLDILERHRQCDVLLAARRRSNFQREQRVLQIVRAVTRRI